MNLGEELISAFGNGRMTGVNPAVYLDDYRKRLSRLGPQVLSKEVLICERDPARFLAALAVALAERARIFLGNPGWGEEEWGQAGAYVRPQSVFGSALLKASQDGSSPRQTEGPIIAIPTGGTGGRVRFASHTEATLRAAAQGFVQHFGGGPIDSWSGLPCFHVSGLMPVIRGVQSGGTFNWASELDPARVPRDGGTTTVLSLVPTQLARLMKQAGMSELLRRFSIILVGGAALSGTLRNHAREAGLPLAPSYGMTETAAAICLVRPSEFLAGDDSSGKPLPQVRIQVEGAASQSGSEGRLLVETPTLFRGYCSESAPPPSPWPTEDTGYLDAAGRLFVTGRIRATINTGGEKVDPQEVEKVLVAMGLAEEAHVFGIPNREWGELVAAVYVPAASEFKEYRNFRELMKKKLAGHKIPKHWISVTEIPRNSRGKPDPGLIHELVERNKGMISDQ